MPIQDDHIRQYALVTAVVCQVVRWVSDEPQPGLVEAQVEDAAGTVWSFIDKEPIFCAVTPTTYPVAGIIRCTIVATEADSDGREVAVIDTGRPDGVASVDGTTRFRVPAASVREERLP